MPSDEKIEELTEKMSEINLAMIKAVHVLDSEAFARGLQKYTKMGYDQGYQVGYRDALKKATAHLRGVIEEGD